ncbi:uncharacterized protein LOC107041564 isoform X2 [Diachasma alloeum]|uniref:uncharacterized protein LOC107041564 isoform X2 n=1 Tax=Diachasma alloeum TaxID=454923 RepID=UPI0007382649|nr:uncharacterized protein LOC107041564 isoform X2 [Diachasma alloeum]
MTFSILSLIFSLFIQLYFWYLWYCDVEMSHTTSFPAGIRYTRLGISDSDVYMTIDGTHVRLLKPLTVKDDITVEWILETEALDYMDLGAFDVIRTQKNISLCNPNLQDPDNRQVFETFTKILLLDITRGCPIHEYILPYKGEILMNFTYFNEFPQPSCDETDWLLIYLHSPSLDEPILTVLFSIHNHAQPIYCDDF